jgi:hypothetical protein
MHILHTAHQRSNLQRSILTTCPQAHGRRSALISGAVDTQLASTVYTPAPEAAAARNGARAEGSRGDSGDKYACEEEGGC